MSKLTDNYAKITTEGGGKLCNSHGFYNVKGTPWIDYYAEEHGRLYRPALAIVYRVGYRTDPGASIYHYGGNKTFNAHGRGAERRKNAVADATEWATKRYGITEWARDPFGSWGPAEFVKAREAELAQMLKNLEAS